MSVLERKTYRGGDLRNHPRRPTSRKIYLVSGTVAMKCALVDVADGGARIRLSGSPPPAGDLYLIDPRVRRIHLTRSVWQSDREVGLQFIVTDTLDHPAGGLEGAAAAAAVFARRLARAAESGRA